MNIIETFYTAFSKGDFETMKSCYHSEATFEDPAFGKLQGKEVGAMWHMLLDRAQDLEITFTDVVIDEQFGQAKWKATYTFSKTGRKVVNEIHAKFKFSDGKIIDHKDSFNFYKWSKQAMGMVGLLIGWTPFFKNKLQSEVKRQLNKFMKKKGYINA